MEYITSYAPQMIVGLGAFIVLIVAMNRFNNPRLLIEESALDGKNWQKYLKGILSWSPGVQSILLKPPRANTTVFRYRLYQLCYALIAVSIYFLLLLQPEIRAQMHEIISWFVTDGTPVITRAKPLVVAAFVVLILPNVPPLRWGDTAIRTWLYDLALIPAQQLREVNRIKIASYHPPQELLERVRELALVEGFDESDVRYDPESPTTQSLWAKCLLLIEQMKLWEADDHYKTAFAVLREPDSDERSADALKEIRRQLLSDALVCLGELRQFEASEDEDKSEELSERETVFRANCCVLLKKIYIVFAGISLHSHYSDNERVRRFRELGVVLKSKPNGPIPNSNDILMLVIILCCILVIPLAFKLGPIRALMIGAMMLSAVLAPVMLARVCPKLSYGGKNTYCPNLAYPIFSGLLAISLGFLIFLAGSQFSPPSLTCGVGIDRYLNCSYPWGILHAGLATLLALRLGVGQYPNVKELVGWRRYRQWGNFTDAAFCAVGMTLIAAFIVVPMLETIRPERFRVNYLPQTPEEWFFWRITLRMALVGFVIGVIVPTWYRAHRQPHDTDDRRRNLENRKRFQWEIQTIKRYRMRDSAALHVQRKAVTK